MCCSYTHSLSFMVLSRVFGLLIFDRIMFHKLLHFAFGVSPKKGSGIPQCVAIQQRGKWFQTEINSTSAINLAMIPIIGLRQSVRSRHVSPRKIVSSILLSSWIQSHSPHPKSPFRLVQNRLCCWTSHQIHMFLGQNPIESPCFLVEIPDLWWFIVYCVYHLVL